jgi:hypothetical protein
MAEPFMGIANVSPIKLPALGNLEDAQSVNDAGDALLAVSQTLLTIADGIQVPS